MRTSAPSLRCMAIIAIAMAMVSVSCSPRKAMQRRCGKADRLVARAVWLCPDVLLRDTATMHMPATTAQWQLAWSDSVHTDSLLAACAALRDALQRQLADTAHRAIGSLPASGPPMPVTQAVRAVQRTACRWEAFTDTVNGTVISVYPSADGTPLLMVEQLPRTVKAPCPPAVQRPPCPGVLEQATDLIAYAGWRLLLWAVLAALALYLFLRFVKPFLNPRP